MTKRVSAVFLLLLILSLTAACRQAAPLAPQEPYAVLLSPADGETLPAGDIQVRIYLQNFALAQPAGQPNRANEGHVIYYLDADAPLQPGAAATTAAGTFAVSAATSYTWPDVPPGKHTLSVQLVNNDSTPLLPPTAVRVHVTVK